MDGQDNVYLGAWTNYARGPVMGATLTTTRQQGDLLIAFTALFVPYAMSRLWRIFCLTVHQYHSTPTPKDSIHHQRQVIFRNASSPDSGLISFVLVLFAWRHLPWKTLARVIPGALLAVVFITVTTVASGYSSQISTAAGDEVLLKGDRCATFNTTTPLSFETSRAFSKRTAERIMAASNYAQQCYSASGSGILDCNRFTVQKIPTAVEDYKAACPFSSEICKSNDSNVRLDTGYIDSTLHFGLNSPKDQRFTWRHVLTCAPLSTEGYTGTLYDLNRTFTTYHYGKSPDRGSLSNFTYSISDLESQYSQTDRQPSGLNYRLSSMLAVPRDGEWLNKNNTFIPIEAISRLDGNIFLAFLSGNGIAFPSPHDDGWYRTTSDNRISFPHDDATSQGYKFAEAASPLACVQQWQWCNPASHGRIGCGPLASSVDAINGALPFFNLTKDQMGMDDQQRAKFQMPGGAQFLWSVLIQNSYLAGISQVIGYLGTNSLASQSSMFSGIQLSLQENQWQLDVTSWWNTMLVMYQAAFIETTIGETNAELQSMLIEPSNQYEKQVCKSQKIRSTAYASFSLFGLLFTYITGALLILVSFVLSPILRNLHERRKYKRYEYLEWCTNDTMQLHRLAHSSESAHGCWMKCTDSIPITKSRVLLAGLDISDPKVPKIRCTTAEPDEDTLDLKDGLRFPLKVMRVTTVPSADTSQSTGMLRNTNAEDNKLAARSRRESHKDNSLQQNGSIDGQQLADGLEPSQATYLAKAESSPASVVFPHTGGMCVDKTAAVAMSVVMYETCTVEVEPSSAHPFTARHI